MLYAGTDPESHFTENTLVYEDIVTISWHEAKESIQCCFQSVPHSRFVVPNRALRTVLHKSIVT